MPSAAESSESWTPSIPCILLCMKTKMVSIVRYFQKLIIQQSKYIRLVAKVFCEETFVIIDVTKEEAYKLSILLQNTLLKFLCQDIFRDNLMTARNVKHCQFIPTGCRLFARKKRTMLSRCSLSPDNYHMNVIIKNASNFDFIFTFLVL